LLRYLRLVGLPITAVCSVKAGGHSIAHLSGAVQVSDTTLLHLYSNAGYLNGYKIIR
jgi:hypothetical protein